MATCSCGREITAASRTGRPRTKCTECSPPRVKSAGVGEALLAGAASVRSITDPPRSTRRRRGPVERAARGVLAEIDTDHAAADLLTAVAERVAGVIDDARDVKDLVAASRELREILRELDTAVLPPKMPRGAAAPGGGALADDDDPFEIGTVLPRVGDAEESG